MPTNLGYSGAVVPQLASTIQCVQADITGLFTVPVLLVPNPGPYNLNRLIKCQIQSRIVTAWTVGASATLDVYHADGASNPVLASLVTADVTLLFSTGINFATLVPKNSTIETTVNDAPIQLKINVANFTGGGNAADIMVVRTYYVIEPLIRVTY